MKTTKEILAAMCDAFEAHDYLRDLEWEFIDEHGMYSEYWTAGQEEEHDNILTDIRRSREKIETLIEEARETIARDNN